MTEREALYKVNGVGIATPIYTHVRGAPLQPGDRVLVVRAEFPEEWHLVGQKGRVVYLEYDCGCGQSFPGDPMIGVRLDGGVEQEFWKEELEVIND